MNLSLLARSAMRTSIARKGIVLASTCLLAGCLLPLESETDGDDDEGAGTAGFSSLAGVPPGGECTWDGDCIITDDACLETRCIEYTCVDQPFDGAPRTGSYGQGCLRLQCHDGILNEVPDATLADDGNPCTQDLCRTDGTIDSQPLEPGSPCGYDGEDYCDAYGVCQECPEDYDDCTIEDCSSGELVVEHLGPGDACGEGSVCSPLGECFYCDDGNACTTEVCDTGERVTTTVAAGTPCGDDYYCTAGAQCFECEDGDLCTTEDCSSGTVVVTGHLAPGSECSPGNVCDPAGACVVCDDGNPCTEDHCGGGIVSHTTVPYGTVCDDGPTDGYCDGDVCVTWCLPVPEPATCTDPGPGEPSNDAYTGAVAYATDESADFPICGRLATSDGADWYSYPASDDSFEYDTHRLSIWSYGATMRACSYVSCFGGDTEILSCSGAFISDEGPEGEPGCCWEGVFRHEVMSVDVECSGPRDSPLVRMRIDAPDGGACLPYEIEYFAY